MEPKVDTFWPLISMALTADCNFDALDLMRQGDGRKIRYRRGTVWLLAAARYVRRASDRLNNVSVQWPGLRIEMYEPCHRRIQVLMRRQANLLKVHELSCG